MKSERGREERRKRQKEGEMRDSSRSREPDIVRSRGLRMVFLGEDSEKAARGRRRRRR
jgi:hypothetical protein